MEEVEKVLPPPGTLKRRVWLLCEEPDSSRSARIFAIISLVCILITIINFCLETIPELTPAMCLRYVSINGTLTLISSSSDITASSSLAKLPEIRLPNYREPFFIIESVCVVWFTIELILRFTSCPSKLVFVKNLMNIFDALAILPYFISVMSVAVTGICDESKKGGMFIVIRVLRVFRIFKLSKHSQVS